MEWEKRTPYLLRKHFGYKNLKCFQRRAIDAWAQHRDCFVLSASGSGKSLCYQLPALISNKVVIVISPLISLMHDQCMQLAAAGVSACFLGSGQPDHGVELRAMYGCYSLVYMCPESLPRLARGLQDLAQSKGIALFAVDEAHCVSKWGHDFRPEYGNLGTLRKDFTDIIWRGQKVRIPVMALTATATDRVRDDVLECLHLSNPTIVITSFNRPNLMFTVHHSKTTHPESYKADFEPVIRRYKRSGGGRRLPCQGLLSSRSKPPHKVPDLRPRQLQDNQPADEAAEIERATCVARAKCPEVAPLPGGNLDDDPEHIPMEFEETDDDVESYITQSTVGDIQDRKETQPSTSNTPDIEKAEERRGGDFEVQSRGYSGSKLRRLRRKFSVQRGGNRTKQRSRAGACIIYMPTRTETVNLTNYFRRRGVKCMAYHSQLPKEHLKQVHELFQSDRLQVVIATIAFGMGINKPNITHVIHYGWPQSLEDYYQESGRAGRDGALSHCQLFVDMTTLPTLLASFRNKHETILARNMLAQCHR
ncbi:hypothetical protein M758_6G103600 [Ceratodon purpureus]|nr:hypothetical protein M758_6G103600 [Ceratodon purpureus]